MVTSFLKSLERADGFCKDVQFCVLDADSDGSGPLRRIGVLSKQVQC